MDPVTDAELDAAEVRGRERLERDPRAKGVRYDRRRRRIVLELTNGCAYAFPASAVQDLQGASPEELSTVQVDGLGFNLRWPDLEVDLYVPALVAGVFGTRAWMRRDFNEQAA